MMDHKILFCNCEFANILPESVKKQVHEKLSQSEKGFYFTPDLCGLAAENPEFLNKFLNQDRVKIAACYSRALKWIFKSKGINIPKDLEVFNMREEPADKFQLDNENPGQETLACEKGEWHPWYPVIDYDRCSGCQQCKDFCLFNVFEITDEDEVRVKNPQNCKTNCPACARICPEAAIIFPKYETAPFNGSDQTPAVTDEQSRVNIKELMKGDLYKTLRNRGKALAEQERDNCACSSSSQVMKFFESMGKDKKL